MPWDYKKSEYDKQAKKDPVWDMERKIMYTNEKLDEALTKKYLKKLNIPNNIKEYLDFLLC